MQVERSIVWGVGDELLVESTLQDRRPEVLGAEMAHIVRPEFVREVITRNPQEGVSRIAAGLILHGLVGNVQDLKFRHEADFVAQEWAAQIRELYAQGSELRGHSNPFNPIIKAMIGRLGAMSQSKGGDKVTLAAKRANFELKLDQVRNKHQLGELAARTSVPHHFYQVTPLLEEVIEGDAVPYRYFNVSPRLLRNSVKLASSVTGKKNPLLKRMEASTWNATKSSSKKQHQGIIKATKTLGIASAESLDDTGLKDYPQAAKLIIDRMQQAAQDMDCSGNKLVKIQSAAHVAIHSAVVPPFVLK